MNANTISKWAIDPGHSVVQFKVKHLAVSNVSGTFKKFKGDVETTRDDFDGAKVSLEIEANSLYTNHDERDGHLKSPLFFDAEKFPVIKFTGVLQKKGGDYELAGDLTIKETTNPVKLEVELTGTGTGRFGDVRTGFEVNGRINRKDYGLSFNMLTPTGNMIVGEDIKLHFDVSLIKQAG